MPLRSGASLKFHADSFSETLAPIGRIPLHYISEDRNLKSSSFRSHFRRSFHCFGVTSIDFVSVHLQHYQRCKIFEVTVFPWIFSSTTQNASYSLYSDTTVQALCCALHSVVPLDSFKTNLLVYFQSKLLWQIRQLLKWLGILYYILLSPGSKKKKSQKYRTPEKRSDDKITPTDFTVYLLARNLYTHYVRIM